VTIFEPGHYKPVGPEKRATAEMLGAKAAAGIRQLGNLIAVAARHK